VNRKRITLAVVFITGILITVIATRTLYQFATNALVVELERDADSLTNILQDRIDAALEVQYSLKALFAVDQTISRTAFAQFTNTLLSHNSDFQAISWRPRVLLADRKRFEAGAQKTIALDYQIYETVDGKHVPAPDRAVYYPVVYNEPAIVNSTALGLNTIQGLPDSVPSDSVVTELKIFTTPPIRLVQTGNVGVVVYQVITDSSDPQRILGLTSVVLQATTLIETAFSKYSADTSAFSIYLYDSAVTAQKLLYVDNAIQQVTKLPIAEGGDRYQTSLELPNRVWTLEFHIAPALIDQRRSRSWLFVLSSGLILTAMLTYHLYYQQQQTAALARRAEAIRNQHAQIQRLNQTKDDVLHIVSHDLRNPLTNIMGYSTLLEEMGADAVDFPHVMAQIRGNGERMLTLINDLLTLEQIESGMTLKLALVSLAQMMREAVENSILAANKKDINIISHLPPSELTVIADAPRLVQIFDNLISNAIKYTPSNGHIVVSAVWEEAQVTIQVSDTGLGIPEEAFAHLFEKFYRIDSKQHRAVDGTGLGLSIVKMLVEKHHGKVGARNNPAGGSTFYVTLPLPPQNTRTDR
jgi:signal transduction histidine kinase